MDHHFRMENIMSLPVITDSEQLAKAQDLFAEHETISIKEAICGSTSSTDISAEDGWWTKDRFNRENRITWWREARFGCFIHWGVYSIAGGVWNGKTCGYGEHLQRAMTITQAEYKEHFIDKFTAEKFDARKWVSLAKDAGMRYLAVTAKHHDGFAMFPSEAYPYDIRMTPFVKEHDPIGELAEECRRQGLKFGVYYSHAFDWGHDIAPGNDWEYENGGGDRKLYEGERRLWFQQHPELVPAVAEGYVTAKSIPQILELIRNYHPDLLWFDTPHKLPFSENMRIMRAIREADPDIVINGRLIEHPDYPTLGDYRNTADRPAEFYPVAGGWEAIPTTNESYGYSSFDKSHKPAAFFIRLIAKAAAKGGNLLMNMGPMGDGQTDPVDEAIFREIGRWMKANGESIYGTEETPLTVQTFGHTCVKGQTLYLHVLDRPADERIILSGVRNMILNAHVLGQEDGIGAHLTIKRLNSTDTLILLPAEVKDSPDIVIAAQYRGRLTAEGGRLISADTATRLHVFDASFHSSTLSFGDGKPGRDYVTGFRPAQGDVLWDIRVSHTGTYRLKIRYSSQPDQHGTYCLTCGGMKQIFPVKKEEGECCDELLVTIDDLKLNATVAVRMEEAVNGGFCLYSVDIAPVALTDSHKAFNVLEDVTDTGDH